MKQPFVSFFLVVEKKFFKDLANFSRYLPKCDLKMKVKVIPYD
jgi:hypothetical protein